MAHHMINPPQVETSSIPERICLGVAIIGGLLLAVVTSICFML
jgi:hypothetical protein